MLKRERSSSRATRSSLSILRTVSDPANEMVLVQHTDCPYGHRRPQRAVWLEVPPLRSRSGYRSVGRTRHCQEIRLALCLRHRWFEDIPFLEFSGILAETLLALFACEDLSNVKTAGHTRSPRTKAYHLSTLCEHVRFTLLVAFGTVEPFPACEDCSVNSLRSRTRSNSRSVRAYSSGSGWPLGHSGCVYCKGYISYCAGINRGSSYASLTYARTYHMVSLG